MSSWSLSFCPYLATHQWNVGVRLRNVIELHPHSFLRVSYFNIDSTPLPCHIHAQQTQVASYYINLYTHVLSTVFTIRIWSLSIKFEYTIQCLLNTCLYDLCFVKMSPNHTPITCKGPIKKRNQISPANLLMSWGEGSSYEFSLWKSFYPSPHVTFMLNKHKWPRIIMSLENDVEKKRKGANTWRWLSPHAALGGPPWVSHVWY